jgi:alcohol dehydrogenase (cytochrome c)
MGSVFLAGDPEYDPTKPLRVQAAAGGGFNALSGDDAYGAIRALDVMTGEMRWEFRLRAPAWTGVLTTAGGLLFSQTDEGDFFALDSDTGKPLWHFALGGNNPRANPVTYEVGGKQYVIVASGNLYMAFTLPDTK